MTEPPNTGVRPAGPRSFTSPSGRRWVVEEHTAPGAVALRFRSAELVLDLRPFPAEWAALPDEALVTLLRRAQPPALGLRGADVAGPSPGTSSM